MSKKSTRGYQSNPIDTSTDRPQGQRRDATAGDETAGQEKDQAGTGASLQEYQFSECNKARTRGVLDSTVNDVYNAIVETVEQKLTVVTLTSETLKDDAGLGHAPNQIGKALRELADAEDCPVHVELWGGKSTTPHRWEVSVPDEPVGVPPERLQYASKTGANARTLHIDDDCQRLPDSAAVTSALATHPPRGEVCTLCAPDLSMDDLGPDAHSTEADEPELVTDGGTDDEVWYVVDEGRGAVVDGPHHERHTAETEAAKHTGRALVATESVIDMMRAQGATIRWEIDDVDVVTDGGQPVDRSGDSATGAIDNEFEDAERSSLEVLLDNESEATGRPHGDLQAGDIAIDLVTRQPLYIVSRVAKSLPSYYCEEEFDLLTYKQHLYLPVGIDDPVFECVFIGGLDDLHSFSNTYDYPAGRLARVPVEIATEDEQS